MPAHIFGVGPYVVPGILQRVEVPDRALNWQIQQGSLGGLGAATIWRGVKLDEGGIVVTTLLTSSDGRPLEDADEAAAAWSSWLATIHPDTKRTPPAWDLSHPLLAAQWPPILRGSHSKNKMVPYSDSTIAWVGSVVLIEYKPLKLATPAQPDPAKLDDKTATPQDKNEQRIQELLEKMRNG